MIIIIIIIMIIISPRLVNTELMSRGEILIASVEGSSLALVSSPSRDGVSIKILVLRHLKPTPQFISESYLPNR